VPSLSAPYVYHDPQTLSMGGSGDGFPVVGCGGLRALGVWDDSGMVDLDAERDGLRNLGALLAFKWLVRWKVDFEPAR
jgi:hypothetical protein